MKINSPPGGAINTTTAMSANYADYLIGVQSVVVDSADRLWILDTGRVQTSNGTLLVSSFGGPKLICVDLTTNKTTQTIIFPQTTVFADSYLNDVRFDLNPSLTSSGKGVAYLSDSSTEGRTGLIIVDLGTGESWRHLDASQYVAPTTQFLAYVWGKALYSYTPGMPFSYLTFGVDGIALSADGETLYFGGVGNRDMWAIPTARLRANGAMSEVLAQSSVTRATQKGVSDGFETDTNGFIYHGNMEQEGISFFNPVNGTDQMFVRDPRISWADTVSNPVQGSEGSCICADVVFPVLYRYGRIFLFQRQSALVWSLDVSRRGHEGAALCHVPRPAAKRWYQGHEHDGGIISVAVGVWLWKQRGRNTFYYGRNCTIIEQT